MPRSVQDIPESSSEDEGEDHEGSIPDTDDDTDKVVGALQRDLEGDAIPAETPMDCRGSTPRHQTRSPSRESLMSMGGTITKVEPDPAVEEVSMGPALRDALRWLDIVDLTGIFCRRANVMRSLHRFVSGVTEQQRDWLCKRLLTAWSVMTKSHSVVGGSSSFYCHNCCCTDHHGVAATREQIQRILSWRITVAPV